MIKADVFDAERIELISDHPYRDKPLLQAMPGSRYDTKEHRWYAPLTWATCQVLRGVFGANLDVGPKLGEWSWEYYRNTVEPALGLRQLLEVEGGYEDLYKFQNAGVKFLSIVRRALLLDDMGTGKTVQAIRTLMRLQEMGEQVFPLIVVAPNNAVTMWQREFAKWWPGVEVVRVKGSAAQRRQIIASPAHVYVCNWEAVRLHSRLAPYGSVRLRHCVECDPTVPQTAQYSKARCERCPKEYNAVQWKSIIADECHRMQDAKSKQTRAVWALRTPGTENVFGLSGTAISDAPTDLWPALHLISKDEWPTRGSYIDRYCQTAYDVLGGVQVVGLKEEMKPEYFSIVDPRMRRMPQEVVLPFLPPQVHSERFVDMSTKQARAYEQMQKGLMAQIDDGLVIAANPLVQSTRMMQFASAFGQIDPETGKMTMADPSNKVDALMEVLGDVGKKPVVVFAPSRQLIELAAKRLEDANISHAKVVGGQKQFERDKAIDDFQAGRLRVILCTTAAGSEAITLTVADTMIFMQRPWSMIHRKQAIKRCHRIGSQIHDSVLVIDLISPGTIEEAQMLALDGKWEQFQDLMRDQPFIANLALKMFQSANDAAGPLLVDEEEVVDGQV